MHVKVRNVHLQYHYFMVLIYHMRTSLLIVLAKLNDSKDTHII